MKYYEITAHGKQNPLLPSHFAGSLAAMPLLPVQEPSLLTWLLIAVIGGIILIFVLIAFILLPLSRQSRKPIDKADTSDMPPPVDVAATQVSVPDPSLNDTIPGLALLLETDLVAVTLPQSGDRPAGIGWHIAGLSDVGLRRELNEDNFIMLESTMNGPGPYGLYVVADGLGGHEAGEVASQLTVDIIKEEFQDNPPTPAAAPFEEWLKGTVLIANQAVLDYQGSHDEAQKMGSTLVMALVTAEAAHVINVGDSRVYRLSGDTIEQVSVDHSLVERLVQIGQITREEARTHKQRNVVYSIIGEKRRLEIGFYQTPLAPGDRLLLCSDGLSGMITDEEILALSRQHSDLAQASQAMVQAARAAGGHDNITAVLIEMDPAS
jgi:serine/threonine protein phosphatase PrpC